LPDLMPDKAIVDAAKKLFLRRKDSEKAVKRIKSIVDRWRQRYESAEQSNEPLDPTDQQGEKDG
jgi:hypothetical protein